MNMRTIIEYFAVLAVVAIGAVLVANTAADAISESLNNSAQMINEAGR